jgi:hypothetical protein
LLEDRIHHVGVFGIPLTLSVFPVIADCPADLGRIGLFPPSIARREIESAVDEHLHAARATRLPRPTRSVDPDIDALHQLLGQRNVVVFEENYALAKLRPLREIDPFADHLPALRVGEERAEDGRMVKLDRPIASPVEKRAPRLPFAEGARGSGLRACGVVEP